MTYYDIIGDVHGCADQLKTLLDRLGYREQSGAYRHPDRTAVFVGDLVDRGEGQLEVLQTVKAMHDAGSAHVVMGNHEFNAICFSIPDPDKPGEFLRPHNADNQNGHAAFTALTEEQRKEYLDWFRTLPLWLQLQTPDGGRLRVIHACWHEPSMRVVEKICGSDKLDTDEHYIEAHRKNGALYRAIENLLKGPEISLTAHGQQPFADYGGKVRTDARARWWDRDAQTLRDIADVRGMRTADGSAKYPTLPPEPVEGFDFSLIYTDPVPVVYGHYWFDWENHREDWTTYTACVDFGAAAEHGAGKLVAYRWNGEPEISWENYVPHDPEIVAPTPSA